MIFDYAFTTNSLVIVKVKRKKKEKRRNVGLLTFQRSQNLGLDFSSELKILRNYY